MVAGVDQENTTGVPNRFKSASEITMGREGHVLLLLLLPPGSRNSSKNYLFSSSVTE